MIDTSERSDLVAIFESHREHLEGECSSQWGGPPDDPTTVWLILAFTKPVFAKALFQFDIIRYGTLVDRLVEGQLLVLVEGVPGNRLDMALQDQRGVVNVELGAVFKDWDAHWIAAIQHRTGAEPDEAKQMLDMARTETILRIENPNIPPFSDLAGVFVDEETQRLIFTSNRMLVNQLRRDGPAVAASFDEHYWAEVEALSSEFSKVTSYAAHGVIKSARSKDEVRYVCGQLIANALNSAVAALELVRIGYRLQPGVLLRPAIEWVSMAAYLFVHPESLPRFKAGKLKSTDIIGQVGKEINPAIPRAWGDLSKDFVHVGKLHHRVQVPEEYANADDPAAKTNLLGIHLTFMVISIVSELVFFDTIASHEYWQEVEPGKFTYRQEGTAWARIEEVASRLSASEEGPSQED